MVPFPNLELHCTGIDVFPLVRVFFGWRLEQVYIGTNLKINLDDNKHIEKDKQDVKPDIKSQKESKQDIKIIKTKVCFKSFVT